MNPTTLSEYYSSQGQSLPSVSARQGLAAQAGIEGYTGSAQQNVQLLGYLGRNQGSTPPTIPVNQALGNTPPANLPNRPQPQEPTNVATSAGAYLASLPRTGVAGLDQITQAMVERPGQLAQEYDIAEKQSLAKEAQFKYDKFNEEYRVKQERIRTEGGRTLEQINQEVNAIERTRAFQAGTLAIEAAYRSGDFQGAKELMNQQIALELEPMKMKYQFFKDLYDRTEDQKFQRAMRNEERAYQSAKSNAEFARDLQMKAMELGVSPTQASQIKSLEDYGTIVGIGEVVKLTPTLPNGKPDIVKEVSNVIQASKKDVPGSSSILGVISSLQKFASDNSEGNFIGAAPVRVAGRLRGAESRQERLGTRGSIEAINLKVQQWASGASLTNKQEKQVARLTPDKNDTDFAIRNKINQLTQFMQQQVKSELATKGINYEPTTFDYFADPVDTYITTSVQEVTDPYQQYLNSLYQN